MATPVWCELVCETCAHTSDGLFFFGGRLNVGLLKKRARGWVFTGDKTFCSKTCAQQDDKP
jgi:hypothetical protein